VEEYFHGLIVRRTAETLSKGPRAENDILPQFSHLIIDAGNRPGKIK
jgi:hypothetical protein